MRTMSALENLRRTCNSRLRNNNAPPLSLGRDRLAGIESNSIQHIASHPSLQRSVKERVSTTRGVDGLKLKFCFHSEKYWYRTDIEPGASFTLQDHHTTVLDTWAIQMWYWLQLNQSRARVILSSATAEDWVSQPVCLKRYTVKLAPISVASRALTFENPHGLNVSPKYEHALPRSPVFVSKSRDSGTEVAPPQATERGVPSSIPATRLPWMSLDPSPTAFKRGNFDWEMPFLVPLIKYNDIPESYQFSWQRNFAFQTSLNSGPPLCFQEMRRGTLPFWAHSLQPWSAQTLGLARPKHTLSIFGCDVLDRRLILHPQDLTRIPTLIEVIYGMKNVRRTDLEDVKHPSPISASKAVQKQNQKSKRPSSLQRTHIRRFSTFRAIYPRFVSVNRPPPSHNVQRFSSPLRLRASHISKRLLWLHGNGLATKKV
jgi:hypothetical protein